MYTQCKWNEEKYRYVDYIIMLICLMGLINQRLSHYCLLIMEFRAYSRMSSFVKFELSIMLMMTMMIIIIKFICEIWAFDDNDNNL